MCKIDIDCNLKSRSGFRSSKHLNETVISIANDLYDMKLFSVKLGRECKSFKGFKRNLHKLDYREFYSGAKNCPVNGKLCIFNIILK